MRSSTLSPKIHRYSMLPPKCISPPCRNIEVMSAIGENYGRHQAVGEDEGLAAGAEVRADTRTPARSATMMPIVTTGVEREGMTSRRGIIGRQVQCKQPCPGTERAVVQSGSSLNDLPTLWNRDRRQSANLLSLRKSHRRTANHAADGRLDFQRAQAIAVAAGRRGRCGVAGAAGLVGSLRVVSTATSRGLSHGIAAYSLLGPVSSTGRC